MAAEQGSGAALNPALTQVLEYDTYNMGRSGSILADVLFERSLAALAVVVGGQVGGILYLLHFLSVPSSPFRLSVGRSSVSQSRSGKLLGERRQRRHVFALRPQRGGRGRATNEIGRDKLGKKRLASARSVLEYYVCLPV